MANDIFETHSQGTGFVPRCHDIPGNSAFGEMIQRRESSRQQEWRFKGRRCGDAKAQGFRHSSHRANWLWLIFSFKFGRLRVAARAYNERICDRKFFADFDCWRSRAFVYLEATNRIGKKIAAKFATFENLCCLGPVVKAPLGRRAIARISPLAWTRVAHRAGIKGIEIDSLLSVTGFWHIADFRCQVGRKRVPYGGSSECLMFGWNNIELSCELALILQSR